jgi:hypothetical protein
MIEKFLAEQSCFIFNVYPELKETANGKNEGKLRSKFIVSNQHVDRPSQELLKAELNKHTATQPNGDTNPYERANTVQFENIVLANITFSPLFPIRGLL